MKKISFFLAIVLCISLLGSFGVLAETETLSENVTVSVEASERVLSADGGSTRLVFLVENTTGSPVTDVKLINTIGNKRLEQAAQINAQSEMSFTIEDFKVAGSLIGNSLVFKITWVQNDTTFYNNCSIVFEAYKPDVSISVVPSGTKVAQGSDVTFKYVIKNTGNVPLYFLNIKDEYYTENQGIVYKETSSGNPLQVGREIEKTVTVKAEKAITSQPVVTATYGSESFSLERTGYVTLVDLTSVDLELSLKPNAETVKAGENITFSWSVSNKGDIKLQDIQVFDYQNNPISVALTLEKGNTLSGTFYAYQVSETGNFAFSVQYSYYQGEVKKTESDTAKVRITVEDPEIQFSIRVDNFSPKSIAEESGTVTFTVTATNNSAFELKNVNVSEKNNAVPAFTISSIPAAVVSNGQTVAGSASKTVSATINKTTTFEFIAIASHNGKDAEKLAEAVSVSVGQAPLSSDVPDNTDEVAPTQEPTTSNSGNLVTVLVWIFIVVLALVVIAGGVLLYINNYQKKNGAKNMIVRRKINDTSEDEDDDVTDADESQQENDSDGDNVE